MKVEFSVCSACVRCYDLFEIKVAVKVVFCACLVCVRACNLFEINLLCAREPVFISMS